MSYYFAPKGHEVGFMRFFLPLGPPCILLALMFFRDVLARFDDRPRARGWLIAALVLCQGGWGVFSSLEQMELRFRYNDVQYRRAQFVRENVPAGSAAWP